MLDELSVRRDSASELWRGASGAWGDVSCVIIGAGGLFSGRGVMWRVILRFSVGLGGSTVAVSVDISVVEDAGLVRVRRSGPVFAPFRSRVCRDFGIGIRRWGFWWGG
jgi:hypothetical protein